MTKEKDILSIDYDDDNDNYVAFTKYLKDDTERRLNSTFKEIDKMGEDYLKEIEQKKAVKNKEKAKFAKYIVKHSRDIYTFERLMSYEYGDVQQIYVQLKDQRRSPINNFLKFLFNL